MRIALDTSTEVGGRTARVLLAENELEFLGVGPDAPNRSRRSGPVGDLAGYDAVVSDGTTPVAQLLAESSVAGVPLVLWRDEPDLHRGPATTPVLVGANLGSALAPALVHHNAADIGDDDTALVAWTEPGKPLRKGEAITFPEPVGSVWATTRSRGRLVAYHPAPWGGAVVKVDGPKGQRVVGISDHAAHLEALCLAAAGVAAATHDLEPAIAEASSIGPLLLRAAIRMELDIAVWRSSAEPRR